MDQLSSSRIKLSQLRALVAVAECGNFSEAALHLEVSQSAVSHAIATLEDELGVVLFTRGRHGATLTPIGERDSWSCPSNAATPRNDSEGSQLGQRLTGWQCANCLLSQRRNSCATSSHCSVSQPAFQKLL
jgi:hypothetical protein